MFSRKYQEELFEKKYNSMKQMDRLEFQNNKIIYDNKNDTSYEFYILTFISLFFSIGFVANYIYLAQLGINSIAHIAMGRIFATFSIVFFAFHIIQLFFNSLNKYKNMKSQEKFLEEHTK